MLNSRRTVPIIVPALSFQITKSSNNVILNSCFLNSWFFLQWQRSSCRMLQFAPWSLPREYRVTVERFIGDSVQILWNYSWVCSLWRYRQFPSWLLPLHISQRQRLSLTKLNNSASCQRLKLQDFFRCNANIYVCLCMCLNLIWFWHQTTCKLESNMKHAC